MIDIARATLDVPDWMVDLEVGKLTPTDEKRLTGSDPMDYLADYYRTEAARELLAYEKAMARCAIALYSYH